MVSRFLWAGAKLRGSGFKGDTGIEGFTSVEGFGDLPLGHCNWFSMD